MSDLLIVLPEPLPSYTLTQVSKHKSSHDCWVTLNNKVYDITSFLNDHPGGSESILQHATQPDLNSIMQSSTTHKHSETAYDILNTYLIGTLATHVHKDSATDLLTPFSPSIHPNPNPNNNFLDLNKPLFWQMITSKFTKQFYLTQVHIPRHLNKPTTVFANPVLELLTRTPWYIVPLFWTPVVGFLLTQSVSTHVVYLYVMGLVLWSFFEYTFHRFLFHIDTFLPDAQLALTLHFLIHGIHHFLPMDRLRLVLPPVFFALIVQPPWFLFRLFFSYPTCCGLFSGGISGYIVYDMVHYYLHHANVNTQYLKTLKTYHLAHHYQEFNAGFGITSKLWDYFFDTVLLVNTE